MHVMNIKELGNTRINGFQGLFSLVNNIASATCDYLETKEQQLTIRADIKTQKEIALKKIEANTIIIKQYFEREFYIRDKVLDEMLNKLDRALKEDNVTNTQLILSAMIEILKANPVESFLDFKKKMQDDDNPIDI